MPTNLFGPKDNYDLDSSHVLPALIRKFHLAKLANNFDVEGIEENEKKYGPIPEPMRTNLFDCVTNRTKCNVTVWGTGNPRREFMYSDDMAEACLFLMNLPDDKFDSLLGSERNTGIAPIVNIGVGSDISIRELAEVIKSVVQFDGNIYFDTEKPDGTPQKLLNIDRLRQLGWTVEPSFIARLEEVYIDYLERI
jgi:GDP-L-fucose synthase